MPTPLTLADFDYHLPPELIAQSPAAERGGSRLLHLDAASRLHDRRFPDLAGLLRPHDLLVFNDTRVIKARLTGQKATGGKVEVLNVKTVLFFLAFLPQFVDPGAPLAPQLALLGCICVTLNTLVDVMAVAAAHRLLRSEAARVARARVLTRVSGTTMVGLGVFLALARRD